MILSSGDTDDPGCQEPLCLRGDELVKDNRNSQLTMQVWEVMSINKEKDKNLSDCSTEIPISPSKDMLCDKERIKHSSLKRNSEVMDFANSKSETKSRRVDEPSGFLELGGADHMQPRVVLTDIYRKTRNHSDTILDTIPNKQEAPRDIGGKLEEDLGIKQENTEHEEIDNDIGALQQLASLADDDLSPNQSAVIIKSEPQDPGYYHSQNTVNEGNINTDTGPSKQGASENSTDSHRSSYNNVLVIKPENTELDVQDVIPNNPQNMPILSSLVSESPVLTNHSLGTGSNSILQSGNPFQRFKLSPSGPTLIKQGTLVPVAILKDGNLSYKSQHKDIGQKGGKPNKDFATSGETETVNHGLSKPNQLPYFRFTNYKFTDSGKRYCNSTVSVPGKDIQDLAKVPVASETGQNSKKTTYSFTNYKFRKYGEGQTVMETQPNPVPVSQGPLNQTKGYRLECGKCPAMFTSVSSLKQHMTRVHSQFQIGTMSSAAIGQSPESASLAGQDIGYDKQCVRCGVSFDSTKSLLMHVPNVHDKNDGKSSNVKFPNQRYMDSSEKSIFKKGVFKKKPGTELKCNECQNIFKSQSSFDRHMIREHNPSFLWQCYFQGCKSRFPVESQLQAHLQSHSKCLQCPEIFNSPLLLKYHMDKAHNPQDPWKCQFENCEYRFPTKFQLQSHFKSHSKCVICHQYFNTPESLKDHMFAAHNREDTFPVKFEAPEFEAPVESDNKCSLCHQPFDTSMLLNLHMIKDHNPEYQHQCRYKSCQYRFATLSELEEHAKGHGNTYNHQCRICDQWFNSIPALETHTAAKHDNLGKVEVYSGIYRHCAKCKVCFETDEALKKHKCRPSKANLVKFEVYSDIFKQCAKCKLCFESDDALKEHKCSNKLADLLCNTNDKLSKPATSGDDSNLKCAECQHNFISLLSLKHHVAKKHNPFYEFRCEFPFCHYRFLTQSELEAHSKSHGNIYAYRCPRCNQGFQRKSEMDSHLVSKHSVIKRTGDFHTCDKCSTAFKSSTELNGHVMKKHCFCVIKSQSTTSAQSVDTQTHAHSCPTCNQCFRSKGEMESHLIYIHGVVKSPPPTVRDLLMQRRSDSNLDCNIPI